ncbi:AfsR/SARP family transcriptional regulator [Amycolatopsis sp. NBC_01480]|uniref:AfsR/SARP family transcriptional regulator n=1 Tax=Amycolatopsis sp. NBC_01480 TaxID=2903562 RepID=UPI002E2E7A72|nr:BTAD domain-containing putative transcriptional regulator [Amycolatopsis sp. NBC_01480]
MTVLVRVLGELSVVAEGQPVGLGPARQRCALAALAVDAGQVVPADRLVHRVWGTQVPRRGRATLHSYISRLRQALRGVTGVAIVRRPGGYLLDTQGTVIDLHRFRDLRSRAHAEPADEPAARLLTEALELWCGEPLTGIDGEWARTQRDLFARERLAAEHELTEARLNLGHGRDLLADLAARAVEHPLDEGVASQYLRALHQAGRRAEALEHYGRTRRQLVEELGIEPGAALVEEHRRLLATAPATAPDPVPGAGAAAGPGTATPRQLPAAPGVFAGRRAELDRLDEVLGRPGGGSVAVAAITGPGGIGKTWLALRWAHRHAHRFPDGQLFVDLRGYGPDGTPMDPPDAVRGFLDALCAKPGRVPLDPNARAALFRSTIAGKRMLLVLDNAADSAQVAGLLPGSGGCAVLVTSRNQLSGLVTRHGAHPLRLDPLSAAEARAVFVGRFGEARVTGQAPAAEELAALCGGYPLALGIVAGHAQARPQLPLGALVAQLRGQGLRAFDDGDPAASLPAVLSWSHRALKAEQVTAFALLGVAPGPDTGLPAAASLLGLPRDETATLLRQLEQASLLDHGTDGRYRMHDLVRQHARDTATAIPERVRAAALSRVTDFYLHTAHAADRRLNPHRDPVLLDEPAHGTHLDPPVSDEIAMAWFDSEHRCLLAAQEQAAARGQHRVVWNLAWALEPFHRRRGHLHSRLTVWQTALDAAAHLPDPAAHILTHRLIGRAHSDLTQHDKAINHLHQSLTLAEHHHDRVNQAHTHRTLAAAWAQLGNDRKARDHAERALHMCHALDDPVWEARAHNAVGWYAAQLGEHDQARAHCEQALTLFRRNEDPEGKATTLDSLGYIEHAAGHHTRAITHYRNALTIFRDLGATYQLADTLDRLGQLHTTLSQHDLAHAAWQEALTLYHHQSRHHDATRTERNLNSRHRNRPD